MLYAGLSVLQKASPFCGAGIGAFASLVYNTAIGKPKENILESDTV